MRYGYPVKVEIRPGLDLDFVHDDIISSVSKVLGEHDALYEGTEPFVFFDSATAYGVQATIFICIKNLDKQVTAYNETMRVLARKGYLSDANSQPVSTPMRPADQA